MNKNFRALQVRVHIHDIHLLLVITRLTRYNSNKVSNGLKQALHAHARARVNLNGEQERSGVVDLGVVEPVVRGQPAAEGDQLPALQGTRDGLRFGRFDGPARFERPALRLCRDREG